ncbi:UNVERIFIED_CONTAM: hypothetical protein ABIE34_003151, partial [Jeotgalibacillus campisalis]
HRVLRHHPPGSLHHPRRPRLTTPHSITKKHHQSVLKDRMPPA